jgi:acetyl-CoA carboxylase biotin carboxylase subunit
MKEAGIPIIPGCGSELKDEEEAVQKAEKIGYPVILKAAYGGGGRGMRIAKTANEVRRFYRVTQMEAASSFGKSEMYIEKQLNRPRHVEIQAIANKQGKVVTLGERECSIQRRYQKLLEEAPSIGINDTTRTALSQAAKKGLEASDYTNAGTVEFLVEDTGNFYFLEVNTRLQVEHLVTELTTGIDIVEEQLSIAFDSTMNLSQNEIEVNGCAINCRINAEDPRRDFTPSPGTVIHYHPPAGPGVRVDSALYSGYTVPEYYDSLILKLSSYGRDRKDAIRRMSGALDELEIIGIPTNISLHQAIMADDRFVAGRFNTAFLDDFNSKLQHELTRLEENAAALAAVNRTVNAPQIRTVTRRKSNWRLSGPSYFHRGSGG